MAEDPRTFEAEISQDSTAENRSDPVGHNPVLGSQGTKLEKENKGVAQRAHVRDDSDPEDVSKTPNWNLCGQILVLLMISPAEPAQF
jgi:hypothetical protein